MSGNNKFHYQNVDDLQREITGLDADIRLQDDFSILATPLRIGNQESANRFAVLPMEGCDSNPDGSPSDLVYRRYLRFAEGGSGLLWCEANAVVVEGRANERQMMITNANVDHFKDLVDKTKEAGMRKNGYAPLMILQLTHSGRYSRPLGHKSTPLVPQHDPILDPRTGVSDASIVSDSYLDSLPEHYAASARLAARAGFDGVDVKACHRYLISELLASFTRKGRYGGSFENRTRLLLDAVDAVRHTVADSFIVASRFNFFDAHPYPYGFGCDKEDFWKFDPTEIELLVKGLLAHGVDLLSNSAGNPYYIYPQVTRPFDTSSMGIPTPEEHQLKSIGRLFAFSSVVQRAAGSVPVVGNGYSWLRQFIPYAAAANIADGKVQMVGLGRSSFAYPDAPRDILLKGSMDPRKCCVACSKCTQIMRDHGTTGCVVRDSAVYAPLFRQFREEAEERENEKKA